MRGAAGLCLVIALAGTPEEHQTTGEPSFCEIVTHPEKYDGQTLRVRAILTEGPESTALYDPGCASDATSTWVEWEGFSDAIEKAPRGIRKKLEKRLKSDRRAYVVLVGRFDGRLREPSIPPRASEYVAKILRLSPTGYGHLIQYRFQFTPSSIEKVEPVQKDVPWLLNHASAEKKD